MKERRIKYILVASSLVMLGGLLFKMMKLPGGMTLSGLLLSVVLLAAFVMCCAIVAQFVKLFIKRFSFLSLLLIITNGALIFVHYYIYSPALKIIVPRGYTGEVNLVRSKLNENMLTLDSNGIGYITKWTFDNVYTKPIVVDVDGKNLDDQCVGFNPSSFWAIGSISQTSMGGSVGDHRTIQTRSFDIVTKSGEKKVNAIIVSEMVDTSKLY